MAFDFPTPAGHKTSEPEPEPESTEPQFGDDMNERELLTAIQEYQTWCSENYPVEIDLGGVPVELSSRMKKTAGKVAHIRGSDQVKHIRYAIKAYQEWGWEKFAETIRHELIHVHTVQNHSTGGHGRLFKSMVPDMDTHRFCEKFAEDEAKYLLFCKECDKLVAQRFKRSKTVKNPGRYQSKCCNAPLRVENNE